MSRHAPNNSFKPNLLRSSKSVAKKACHAFASTTQVGLTQALGSMSRISNIIDAIRRIGSRSQKSALARQDRQLEGQEVLERGRILVHHEGEAIAGFHATVEPYPEEVSSLSPTACQELAAYSSMISDFFSDFGVKSSASHLEQLDESFAAWLHASDKLGYSEDSVVKILGSSFGEHCNETLDMQWVNVSDQYGQSTAVDGREFEFRAFPFDSIWKRIDDSECDFFVSI